MPGTTGEVGRGMADVDFFWDPMCPWAWITSRWMVEVQEQRHLDVDWRFIALRVVNEDKDYDKDFPPRYPEVHGLGLRLLRVAAAVREQHGREHLGPLYTALGNRIHVEGDRDSLLQPEGVAALLTSLGLPGELVSALEDTETYDKAVRADTATALERAGKDIGTPVITFAPPDGPSFFGPVISRIPRGQEALDLWEATERIARFPGFAELKRSIRERPQVA
jgi:2-hydroxychromene-2-carboxylate isomerase